MDTRGLSVRAADAQTAELVGGVCLAAMEALNYRSRGLVVTVASDPHGRPGVEASASKGGIFVSPALTQDPRRLIWVLHEEIAHRYLNEVHGIPHGGDFVDRFAQEGFAAWFQWTRVIPTGLFGLDEVTTQSISELDATPKLGHDLGKHLGAALGGSVQSRERLEDWLARDEGDPALKTCVRTISAGLLVDDSPSEVASAVATAHASARRADC